MIDISFSTEFLLKNRLRLEHLLRYLRALPTIHVHPELDGRTLHIVHSLKGVTMSANTGCEDSKTKLLFVLANERMRVLFSTPELYTRISVSIFIFTSHINFPETL